MYYYMFWYDVLLSVLTSLCFKELPKKHSSSETDNKVLLKDIKMSFFKPLSVRKANEIVYIFACWHKS